MKNLLFILLMPIFTQATNFYISPQGNDNASGTSSATPWRTISKINSSKFNPGDQINLQRGGMWREMLVIPSSGAAGSPITITAYGTGAKPILNGADLHTGWVNYGANIWGNAALTQNGVALIMVDGELFSEVNALNKVNQVHDRPAMGNPLSNYFLKTASNPDSIFIFSRTNPNTRVVESMKREAGIVGTEANKIHHVNISNIECRYASKGIAFFAKEGTHFVGNCRVDYVFVYCNRTDGVVFYDGHGNNSCTRSRAEYNGNQFYVWNEADNCEFLYDSSFNSINYVIAPGTTDGHGQGNYRSTGWLVENCYSVGDYDQMHPDAEGRPLNCIIRYNKCFNSKFGWSGNQNHTPSMGFGSNGSGGLIQFYYNLLVNPSQNGFESFTNNLGRVQVFNNTIFAADNFMIDGGGAQISNGNNIQFKNNIIARLDNTPGYMYLNYNGTISNVDYNQYYQSAALTVNPYRFYFNSTELGTFELWKTASGQDAHSKTGNPMFINEANDWRLQASSPAINAGVNVGLTRDLAGNSIVGLPDMGAYEFGGKGEDPKDDPKDDPKEDPKEDTGSTGDAGADQTINDNTATLGAAASTTTYKWKKLSGPTGGRIVNTSGAQTNVKNLKQGVYEYELSVTKGSAVSTDTVRITVQQAKQIK